MHTKLDMTNNAASYFSCILMRLTKECLNKVLIKYEHI